MTVDVACAGTAYLDLTFVDLEALPRPGRERHARELLRSPGGSAITAIGATRLGLRTALASPLGADDAGAFLRGALEAEGVQLAGGEVARTAITAVMPAEGDRALATFDPGNATDAAVLERLEPRAVVCQLDQLDLVPAGARAYATVGDAEAAAHAGRPLDALTNGRTLFVNAFEARALAGTARLEDAMRALASYPAAIVVTLGGKGALALVDGELVRASGHDVGAVDPTGAGDLFAAAWVWADLLGADLEARLRWATLYAALSVTVPTAVAGALTVDRLVEEGTRRGLVAPSEQERTR